MNIQKLEQYETIIKYDVLADGEPYTAEVIEDDILGYVDLIVYDYYGNKIIDEKVVDSISNYIYQNYNI